MTWKHFPYYWPFVRESMAVKGWIPLTKYPQCRRWSFFDVSWTKLLNEQSNYIWFSKMPWNSCGFTVIHYISMHRVVIIYAACNWLTHDDVIKWKHFPRYWPLVRGIHWSSVPLQRPVMRGFDVFFNLRLNKRLGKQSRRRWFERLSRSPLGQYNATHAHL